jgi:quinol monooxygenase YgiN
MYGTIARIQVAPENRPKLESVLADWEREVRPTADGVKGTYLFWPDREPDTAYLVAIFGDEERYRRNADSPQQDAWYRRFRELLKSDPEWMDGHFVTPTAA